MAAREAYSLWFARARHDLRIRSPRLRLRLAQRERAVEGAVPPQTGPYHRSSAAIWQGPGPCPDALERGFRLRACEVACYSLGISVFSENPGVHPKAVPERKR